MKNIKIIFLLLVVFSCTKAPNIFDDITDRGGIVFFETEFNSLHDILGENDTVIDINLIDPNGNAISNSIAILKEDGTLTEPLAEIAIPGNLTINRQAIIDALGLTTVEEIPINLTFISTVTISDGTVVSGLQSSFDSTLGEVTGGDTHYDGIQSIPNQAMKFRIVLFKLIEPNSPTSFFIDSENNDVEEVVISDGEPIGDMDLSSSDLEFGEFSSGDGLMAVGLRFNFVGLPQGANITSAKIQFQTDTEGSNPVELTIYGENSGNSAPFKNAPRNLTDRNLTDASTIWNIPPWNNVGDRGPNQLTVDFSSIIQEIVSRSDWIPGNSITIILKPTGVSLNASSSSGGREAEAGIGDDSAELILSYTN